MTTMVSPEPVAGSQTIDRPSTSRSVRYTIARSIRLRPAALLGVILVTVVMTAAVFADVLAPIDPWSSVAKPFQPPSSAFPFGTDDLGRDVLAGTIHGARTSLIVALTAAALSILIGSTLGALSGYFGGFLDDALMRFTEFFQVIPRFFLVLLVVALFKPGLLTITLVLGLTAWPMTTRLLRAQVLSTRERDYILASRALGMDHLSILWRHVLPNSFAPIVVQASFIIGQVILIETSLAFLGLSDPNNISWGYLLNNAQPFLRYAWWMALFPGLAIVFTVLGFNLLGDSFNDARMKGV